MSFEIDLHAVLRYPNLKAPPGPGKVNIPYGGDNVLKIQEVVRKLRSHGLKAETTATSTHFSVYYE